MKGGFLAQISSRLAWEGIEQKLSGMGFSGNGHDSVRDQGARGDEKKRVRLSTHPFLVQAITLIRCRRSHQWSYCRS
jgi:hypothetical protein